MKYHKFKIEQIGSLNIKFKTSPRNKTVFCLSNIHPIKAHIKTEFNGIVSEKDICNYYVRAVDSGKHKFIEPGTIVYLLPERGL